MHLNKFITSLSLFPILLFSSPIPIDETRAMSLLTYYFGLPGVDHPLFQRLEDRAIYRVPVEDIPAMFDKWIAFEKRVVQDLTKAHAEKYGLGGVDGHDALDIVKANHDLAARVGSRQRVIDHLEQQKANWEHFGGMNFMDDAVESRAVGAGEGVDENGLRRSKRRRLKKEVS